MTVPTAVRQALGIEAGDAVVFRVEGTRATMARADDFLELAGVIRVPAGKRNAKWEDVLSHMRSERRSRPSV